jgi:hypothetical protein
LKSWNNQTTREFTGISPFQTFQKSALKSPDGESVVKDPTPNRAKQGASGHHAQQRSANGGQVLELNISTIAVKSTIKVV